MARLYNMMMLMAVVFHLVALLLPATAHATIDHAPALHADMHAQVDHDTQPDGLCCAVAAGNAALETDGFCAICAVSCTGMQATLEAAGPLPFALSLTSHLAFAEQALRSAATEAALRPPKSRS